MAGKKPVDPLKAKEARQKKIAIGGAVVLAIVLVIQVPKLMKQMSHSSAPPPVPASTSVAAPTPATPGATASPTPTTATPGSGSTGTGSLLSASAPTAAVGQLTSFGRFAGKDPFAAQTPAAAPAPASKPGGKTPKSPPTPPTPPTPPSPPATTPAQTYSSALISVNGVKETVTVGGNFPARQPFFHLVSVSAHSAQISIAGGTLANGAKTVTLHESQPLTLMNTTDGTRYKIVLLPQPANGSAGGTSTTTGGTTSTPATTTGTTTSH